MKTRIAFIGLGHMGHPMVINLLKQGFEVHVFDLLPEAVESAVKAGAVAASTAADAVKHVDVVMTMLQTGEQVSATCLGADGIFNHMSKKALYIDSSSIDIEDTRKLHQEAKKLNLAMVDAPVSGGVKGAEAAALTIMVGGEGENFQRAKPILEMLGKKVIHAGEAGSGQAAKICNNMILAISMVAVSEAFKLGEKLGLDPKKFFEISSNASGQCWSMTSYCPVPGIMDNVPSNNQYQPGFTSSMMLKDLHLSQDAATSAQAFTPLGKAATELYERFVNEGNAELDFSGIILMMNGKAS